MSGNPFPGPQPYRAADRKRFYGRESLIKKLSNQILARAATTVFGPSGAGKSSLLQAGVIPALEDSDDIRLVRVDAWPLGEAPLPWLVNAISSDLELGLAASKTANLEALQATIDLAGRQSDRPLVIYLDQFEQVFIGGHDAVLMQNLLQGLTWLIRRNQNRELHLVISLREDYLGRLRDWTREKPELSAHGFRVGPLTVGEMVKAMCRTAADGDPPQSWKAEEIHGLMTDVRVPGQSASESAEIQAAFAQIVCRAIWEERAAGNKLDIGRSNAETILQRYLDQTLANLGPLQESALKLLEQQLIDEEGHRTLLTEKEARLVLPAAEAGEVLAQLEQAAILHAEEHQGSRYFELGHDWLAKKVFERRIERKKRAEEEAEAAAKLAAARKFRRLVGFSGLAWIILGSLVSWALIERNAAKNEKRNADLQTEIARKERDAAVVAERKAQQASRMASARELMLRGNPDLAALVLSTVDEPEKARGWMQTAIDVLKVRVPRTTIHSGLQEQAHAWSKDGRRLLMQGKDGQIRIDPVDRTKKPILIDFSGDKPIAAEFSPDEQLVAITGARGALGIARSDGTGKTIGLQDVDAEFRINGVAFSHDNARIAAISADAKVLIANTNGSGARIVQTHDDQVIEVSWNPKNTTLMTAVLGSGLVIREPTQEGREIAKFIDEAMTSPVWSPDGSRFAVPVARMDQEISQRTTQIAISSAGAKSIEYKIDVGKGNERDTRWSPDGKRLVVAIGNLARIIRADGTGESIELRGHTDNVLAATWSPDGQRIATLSMDKTIRVWNADGKHSAMVLVGNTDALFRSIDWSADGKWLMSISADGATGRKWQMQGPAEPVVFEQNGHLLMASWQPHGDNVLVVDSNGGAGIWAIDGSGKKTELHKPKEAISSAEWSSDGKFVFVNRIEQVNDAPDAAGDRRSSQQGRHAIMRAGNGEVNTPRRSIIEMRPLDRPGVIKTLAEFDNPVEDLVMSPDGRHILTRSGVATITAISTHKDSKRLTFVYPERNLQGIYWSPDSKHFATTSYDGVTRLWTLSDTNQSTILPGEIDGPASAAWSPDGTRFAVGTNNERVFVWNVDKPEKPIEFVGLAGSVLSLAFSPDGTRFATATDETLRIWKSSGDDKPLQLKGHAKGRLLMVQWSSDGNRLVTASDDKTARIWDANGREPPIVLEAHGDGLRHASWSPDGKRILTISGDQTARVWLVDIPLLKQALQQASTDCLSVAEREAYLAESSENARRGYEECEIRQEKARME